MNLSQPLLKSKQINIFTLFCLPSNSSLSTLMAAASISLHFSRTASVVLLLGGGNCTGANFFPSFSRSLVSSFFGSFSFLLLFCDDELLLLLLPVVLLDCCCFVFAALMYFFFQFLINVFDRLITASSLLVLRRSLTVMPMCVLVKTSKFTDIFCSCFNRSNACSWPCNNNTWKCLHTLQTNVSEND